MTYEVCRLKGWTASNGDNTRIFSPKWTYTMVNGGIDDGSSMSDTLAMLRDHGAATWSQFPYDTDAFAWCTTPSVWKSALTWRPAMTLRLSDVTTPAGVDLIKEQIRLAAGNPLSIRQQDVVLTGHSLECRLAGSHHCDWRQGRCARQ